MRTFVFLILSFWLSLAQGQNIVINEVQASNQSTIQDDDGDYSDWIEIFNADTVAVNLQGYGLSDDYSRPFRWVFPSYTLAANEYLIIWASGKNRRNAAADLHTNFSISAAGEEVILTRPDSVRLDESPPTAIPTDLSFGRFPNGSGPRGLFLQPTPGAVNASPPFSQVSAPVFSHPSGFYNQNFPLLLSHPDSSAVIVYSLDGSEPMLSRVGGKSYVYKNQYPFAVGQATGPLLNDTMWSFVFNDSIYIVDRSSDSNTISMISSTFDFQPYLPPTPVKKATVVRAKVYLQGDSSNVVTNTYFVQHTFPGSLPIVSLSTDAAGLFDYHDGIYVAGVDFDQWRAGRPNSVVHATLSGANFHRRGIDNELAASFEYFDQTSRVFDQNIGIRIHGNTSRISPMKSLRLYARSQYDNSNSLDYPFFGSNERSSYKRLILRNSGQDFHRTHFRDAFLQESVKHLPFATQRYQPTEVFINGEYFGVANIRTRYDKHFMEAEFGIQENELDLLDNNAEVIEGNNVHYLQMRQFISNNDMAISANMDSVAKLMDLENFTDYHISNIFFSNFDWPGNNIIFFRKQTPAYDSLAPYGQDGRWRWMLFDTEHGFGLQGSPSRNILAQAVQAGNTSWPNPDWSTIILRNLLENLEYRAHFINRFADLMNTTFDSDRMIAIIDSFADRIEPYVNDMHHRWSGIGPLATFQQRLRRMRRFAERRVGDQQEHILDVLNVDSTLVVHIDVSDTLMGYVQWSTLDLLSSTVGIESPVYPWEGTYFYNIPINAKAIPYPGYQFSHWSGSDSSTLADISLLPLGDIQLTAHFTPVDTQEVLYYWAMTSSLPNNTPLLSMSSTYAHSGVPAQILFQSAHSGYPFSSGHPLWRNSSMERRNQPTSLHYLPYANFSIPYSAALLRGLQIKQTLKHLNDSVAMIFSFSTRYHKNIKLDMAVMDEGAADAIFVDYFHQGLQDYSTQSLSDSIFPLTTAVYSLISMDFSSVAESVHRDSFDVRIRFISTNAEANNGDRVTFNNIGIKGTPITYPCDTAIFHFFGCGVAFDRLGNPHYSSTTIIDTQAVVGGCDSIFIQHIEVFPLVQHHIIVSDTLVCYGDSILLQADTSLINIALLDSIHWFRNAVPIGSGLQFNAGESGVYQSVFFFTNGCIDTSTSISLTVLPRVVIDSLITLCISAPFFALNDFAPVPGIFSGPGVVNDTFYPGNVGPGSHVITYTYTDVYGCSDTLFQTIELDSFPRIFARTPINICQGDTVVLETNIIGNSYSYTWFRNGQPMPGDTTRTLSATQSGIYRVQINDSVNCNVTSDSLIIPDFNAPYTMERLCFLTTDTATNHVLAFWTQTDGFGTEKYSLSATNVSGTSIRIQSFTFDTINYWVDPLPALTGDIYRYNLSWQDTCGASEFQAFDYYNIVLQGNEWPQEVNLQWNAPYQDSVAIEYTVFQRYQKGAFQPIATTLDTVIRIAQPLPGKKQYFVAVTNTDICVPTLPMNDSSVINQAEIHSNMVEVGQELNVQTHANIPIVEVFPNPTANTTSIISSIIPERIVLFDALGNRLQIHDALQSKETMISLANYASGVYFIYVHWNHFHVVKKLILAR